MAADSFHSRSGNSLCASLDLLAGYTSLYSWSDTGLSFISYDCLAREENARSRQVAVSPANLFNNRYLYSSFGGNRFIYFLRTYRCNQLLFSPAKKCASVFFARFTDFSWMA